MRITRSTGSRFGVRAGVCEQTVDPSRGIGVYRDASPAGRDATLPATAGVPNARGDQDASQQDERGGLDDEDAFGEHDFGGGSVGATRIEDVDVHRDDRDEE